MMQGFLPMIKPPGMTSSDAVVYVRRMLPKGVKIGHAGTLDPMAAGVLPLMLGKATRLFDDATTGEKQYVASICFGIETDTQDSTGSVTSRSGRLPDPAELREVLSSFVGEIHQTPPAYSALKQDGKRMYEWARQGVEVKKASRVIHIDAVELMEMLSPKEALIRVSCAKGTYIRTLCVDIARALSCKAHMGFLLRTRAGSFRLENAAPLEQVTPDSIGDLLLPIDTPLAHLHRVEVSPDAEARCRNGNVLRPCDIQSGASDEQVRARVYLKGEFIGLGLLDSNGCKFSAMLKTWEEA